MSIVKSRLVKELTVQQVIQCAMKKWGDKEPDVLNYVAGLLDTNDQILFYRRAALPERTDKETGKTYQYDAKVCVLGGVHAVSMRLRRMARDGLSWDSNSDDIRVRLEYGGPPKTDLETGETTCPAITKTPVGGLMVAASDIVTLFEANDLPVPDWADEEQEEIETADDRPRGEPKAKTIGGWKEDYEKVQREMKTYRFGPSKAAQKAHVPGGRSADAIYAGWRRYKKHIARTAKRQNDESPN